MGSGFLFLAVVRSCSVSTSTGTVVVAFAASVLMEAFGFFPGMAFTGDSEEGKAGEEQGDSFHSCVNLPALACLFNFLFGNRGS